MFAGPIVYFNIHISASSDVPNHMYSQTRTHAYTNTHNHIGAVTGEVRVQLLYHARERVVRRSIIGNMPVVDRLAHTRTHAAVYFKNHSVLIIR